MNKDKFIMGFIFLIIMMIILIEGHSLLVLEIFSLALFFFMLLKFIFELGYHLSIKNIIVLLMAMQWLLGPVLGYIYDVGDTSYQMKVDKSIYFSYVLPATLAFMIGIFIKLSKTQYKPNFLSTVDYYQKGLILIILGFLFEFLPWFGFLGYLLAGLKYAGAFYMVLTKNEKRYLWIGLVFSYLFFIRTLAGGMFHEMLLWSCFLLILIFYFNRKSILFRFSIIFFGFFFVFIIQLVKPDYREQIGKNIEDENYIIFFKLVSSKFIGDQPLFSDEVIASNVVRLNQGWIISNVMNYIPAQRPYANGKTIKDAVIASVFPRFLYPDKPVAGGRENMENYAGITLNASTSMDISQVGEAYANFGVIGGIIMMFFMGLFFNAVITFVEKKCQKHPELILWIPLLFLQVIKAETSLVTVLNHLVKASLVTWFFFSPYGQKILNYRFNKWRFGVRTFRLSSTGLGTRGVRKRKGHAIKKGYLTFEERVRRKL